MLTHFSAVDTELCYKIEFWPLRYMPPSGEGAPAEWAGERRGESSVSVKQSSRRCRLPVSVSSLSICVTLSKTEVDDLLQVFFLSTCFGEHHKGARALGTYCGYQVNQVVKLYRDWKLD